MNRCSSVHPAQTWTMALYSLSSNPQGVVTYSLFHVTRSSCALSILGNTTVMYIWTKTTTLSNCNKNKLCFIVWIFKLNWYVELCELMLPRETVWINLQYILILCSSPQDRKYGGVATSIGLVKTNRKIIMTPMGKLCKIMSSYFYDNNNLSVTQCVTQYVTDT